MKRSQPGHAAVQPPIVLCQDRVMDSSEVRLRPPRHLVSPRARLYWAVRALTGRQGEIDDEAGWQIVDTSRLVPHVAGLVVTVLVAAVHVTVMPLWRYRVHRWEATPEAVYTQSGWFNQERRIAPVSRIQTVDSERGPFEQLFRLANVTVTTASAAGPLKIHGLDRATAQRLVDRLTEGTGADQGDATGPTGARGPGRRRAPAEEVPR